MSLIRKMATFLGALLMVAALALAIPGVARAQTQLRMANWIPLSHDIQESLALWIAEFEEAAAGTMEIELMQVALAPAEAQYDLVRNGAVDIAYGVAAFTPERFALFRALEVPFMFQSAEAASAGHWEWYVGNGFDEVEFNDTKLIAVFSLAPFLLHAREPLTSLADLDGMKVRAGGTGIEILRRLGAAPVFISPAETTEAIRRGTVDATQFNWEALVGFRLIEIVTHHLEIPQGLYGTAFWVAMNRRAWDGLTREQQAAIETVGLSGSRLFGARWDEVEAVGRRRAIDNGNTITTLGDADTARLREVTAYVEADWITAANDMGLHGQALIDGLKATIAKYE